jgi:hypothetical protein
MKNTTTTKTRAEKHYSKAAQARCQHERTIGMDRYAVCIQCEAVLEVQS